MGSWPSLMRSSMSRPSRAVRESSCRMIHPIALMTLVRSRNTTTATGEGTGTTSPLDEGMVTLRGGPFGQSRRQSEARIVGSLTRPFPNYSAVIQSAIGYSCDTTTIISNLSVYPRASSNRPATRSRRHLQGFVWAIEALYCAFWSPNTVQTGSIPPTCPKRGEFAGPRSTESRSPVRIHRVNRCR